MDNLETLLLLGGVVSFFFFIIGTGLFNFYKRYKGDGATLMTVLSVILLFMGPLYVFSLKNARPL